MKRSVDYGGLYRDVPRDIGRRSSVSPLFGAKYLKPINDALDRARFQFAHYMDGNLIEGHNTLPSMMRHGLN